MGEIQNGIAYQHHQLVVFAAKFAGQRMIAGFKDHAIADPLPELFLRRPEFLPVTAHNQRSFLLLFFLCILF